MNFSWWIFKLLFANLTCTRQAPKRPALRTNSFCHFDFLSHLIFLSLVADDFFIKEERMKDKLNPFSRFVFSRLFAESNSVNWVSWKGLVYSIASFRHLMRSGFFLINAATLLLPIKLTFIQGNLLFWIIHEKKSNFSAITLHVKQVAEETLKG